LVYSTEHIRVKTYSAGGQATFSLGVRGCAA
jgi:hypothetical protein